MFPQSQKSIGAGMLLISLVVKALNAVSALDFIRMKTPEIYRIIASPLVFFALLLVGIGLLTEALIRNGTRRKQGVAGRSGVTQTTTGHSSPVLSGISGPVTITYNQGLSATAPALPPQQRNPVYGYLGFLKQESGKGGGDRMFPRRPIR